MCWAWPGLSLAVWHPASPLLGEESNLLLFSLPASFCVWYPFSWGRNCCAPMKTGKKHTHTKKKKPSHPISGFCNALLTKVSGFPGGGHVLHRLPGSLPPRCHAQTPPGTGMLLTPLSRARGQARLGAQKSLGGDSTRGEHQLRKETASALSTAAAAWGRCWGRPGARLLPALRRMIWSFWQSSMKPSMRLANSTTYWMALEICSEHCCHMASQLCGHSGDIL